MTNRHRVFSVREDRGDGLDLRRLSFGGEQVSDRLYFAVRDEWWRTVPLSIVAAHRGATEHGFAHHLEAVAGWASHPLTVRISYVAEGGELRADFTAIAGGPFRYRRIGFCLLLAADALSGRAAVSWRSGTATELVFPTAIVTRDWHDAASARFHRPFDALDTALPSGTRVRYSFAGEEFEFEDQRNWTDATYKAYSVQPPGGWPLSTVVGSRFSQSVRVRVEPATAGPPADFPARTIAVGAPIATVPPVGLFSGRLSPRSFRPGGGFQELNAKIRDPGQLAGYDSIELAVNGAVHAADDDSVLETTALHGRIVEQTRRAHPGRPVRLAPVSFLDVAGDWRDAAGHYAPEPVAQALPARLLGPFAATWLVASAARLFPAHPDAVRYFDARLPADSPAARVVARLRQLAGQPVLRVTAPGPLAALGVAADGRVHLAVANTGPDPVRFQLPDGRASEVDGFASAWFSLDSTAFSVEGAAVSVEDAAASVEDAVASDEGAAAETRPAPSQTRGTNQDSSRT